jgi:murein L,D-transpeptidase YcbB/YkuD
MERLYLLIRTVLNSNRADLLCQTALFSDTAVREFQQQKGLPVDGLVGDETRRLLGI